MELEALEKIKENLNITSMNEMTLRSVLIEIRWLKFKYLFPESIVNILIENKSYLFLNPFLENVRGKVIFR